MKVLLFGTGEYYQRYKIWFENEEILALIDNSEEKQGTYIDGKEVIAPNDISKFKYDAIFILTFSVAEITTQLLNLGIDKDKIYSFNYIHDFIYRSWKRKEIHKYGKTGNNTEIALLSQDLSLGGPALALYNVARILQSWGYSVTYASMVDGPLRTILLEDGISVIVDSNMLAETMNNNEWIAKYSLVICNTINFHVFLSERDMDIPVIWWVHDAEFFYRAANITALKKISNSNLTVVAVGPIARNAMRKYRLDFEIGDLLYGVEEVTLPGNQKRNSDIIQFVTIGFVEPHKGQDLLIKAVKALPDVLRQKCRFLFVGKNTSLFASELMRAVLDIPEVQFVGTVDRGEIHSILSGTDVLVCPSRQDCMPTVCSEAMMHSVPCLVSDATGTAAYITGENGRVFPTENIDELKKQIVWFIDHKDDIASMGEKARIVYEKYFSMQAFSNSLKKIISDKMSKIF